MTTVASSKAGAPLPSTTRALVKKVCMNCSSLYLLLANLALTDFASVESGQLDF